MSKLVIRVETHDKIKCLAACTYIQVNYCLSFKLVLFLFEINQTYANCFV